MLHKSKMINNVVVRLHLLVYIMDEILGTVAEVLVLCCHCFCAFVVFCHHGIACQNRWNQWRRLQTQREGGSALSDEASFLTG